MRIPDDFRELERRFRSGDGLPRIGARSILVAVLVLLSGEDGQHRHAGHAAAVAAGAARVVRVVDAVGVAVAGYGGDVRDAVAIIQNG